MCVRKQSLLGLVIYICIHACAHILIARVRQYCCKDNEGAFTQILHPPWPPVHRGPMVVNEDRCRTPLQDELRVITLAKLIQA
jgi:hypothetical protein